MFNTNKVWSLLSQKVIAIWIYFPSWHISCLMLFTYHKTFDLDTHAMPHAVYIPQNIPSWHTCHASCCLHTTKHSISTHMSCLMLFTYHKTFHLDTHAMPHAVYIPQNIPSWHTCHASCCLHTTKHSISTHIMPHAVYIPQNIPSWHTCHASCCLHTTKHSILTHMPCLMLFTYYKTFHLDTHIMPHAVYIPQNIPSRHTYHASCCVHPTKHSILTHISCLMLLTSHKMYHLDTHVMLHAVYIPQNIPSRHTYHASCCLHPTKHSILTHMPCLMLFTYHKTFHLDTHAMPHAVYILQNIPSRHTYHASCCLHTTKHSISTHISCLMLCTSHKTFHLDTHVMPYAAYIPQNVPSWHTYHALCCLHPTKHSSTPCVATTGIWQDVNRNQASLMCRVFNFLV